jgi:hypothetical protein
MEKTNPYQQLLDDNSKTQNATLQASVETASTAKDSVKASKAIVDKDLKEAQEYLNKMFDHLQVMKQLSQSVLDTSLTGKNAATLATTVSSDSAKVSAGIAKAARSIEAASQSMSQLYSDAAGMQAKASSEDSNTDLSRLADEASSACKTASAASETSTMMVLDATILAARSNAVIAGDTVKKMSADIDAVYAAVNATTMGVQVLADKASADLVTAITNDKASELQESSALIDDESADEAWAKLRSGPVVAAPKKAAK